jgi:hypothetical protein
MILLVLCGAWFGGAWGYTIPQGAADAARRAAAIDTTRVGFLYGPAVAGGPSYPSGPLGTVKVTADIANEQLEASANQILIEEDTAHASNSSAQVRLLLNPGQSSVDRHFTVSRFRHVRRISASV